MSVLLTFGQSKRLCVNQSRATGQQRAIRPRRCSIFLCFRERDFERKELKKREFGSLIYQKGSGEEEEKKPYWLLSGVCVSSALGLLTRPSSLKASTLLLYNPSAFFSRWFHFEFFSLPSCIFISPPCVSPASSSHSTHNPNAPAWYAVWSGGGERKLQAYPPVIIQVLFFFFSFFLSPLLLLLLFLFSLSTSILPFFSTWDEVKKKKKSITAAAHAPHLCIDSTSLPSAAALAPEGTRQLSLISNGRYISLSSSAHGL